MTRRGLFATLAAAFVSARARTVHVPWTCHYVRFPIRIAATRTIAFHPKALETRYPPFVWHFDEFVPVTQVGTATSEFDAALERFNAERAKDIAALAGDRS